MQPTYYRSEVFALALFLVLGLVAQGFHAFWPNDSGPLQVEPLRLDANRASRAALTALPGVGPARADRIVRGRPYGSLEEVRPVVGENLFEKISEHLTVAPVGSG